MSHAQPMSAVTAATGTVPARVVGAGAVAGTVVGKIVPEGGAELSAGVALVILIDGSGRGEMETCSFGFRVYTRCASIDTFEIPESFKKTSNVL